MKWFEIWFDYMTGIIETMVRNMQTDLDAGYNPKGFCIRKQRIDIESKKLEFDIQMDKFGDMEDAKVNRWCYYTLKRKGVIS